MARLGTLASGVWVEPLLSVSRETELTEEEPGPIEELLEGTAGSGLRGALRFSGGGGVMGAARRGWGGTWYSPSSPLPGSRLSGIGSLACRP